MTHPGGDHGAGEPLISVRELHVDYVSESGSVQAVAGVSFDLRPGECVALVGESGSGKTTVGLALLGLLDASARVDAEQLRITGQDALTFDDGSWRVIRGGTIGLVLQDALGSLDPLRSIGQEVGEAMRGRGHRLGRRERQASVVEQLRRAGLEDAEHRVKHRAHQLSGGQRQRALIATSVAGEPAVLIADEPTTALDVTVQRQVIDLLSEKREQGLGVVLISHDLAVVSEIADWVIVLRGGEVVEQGRTSEVLTHPAHEYTRALIQAIPGEQRQPDMLPTVVAEAGTATVDGDEAEGPSQASIVEPVLQARELRVEYRAAGRAEPILGLDDVSIDLHRGRALGVVGESGSGKSTLLRVLLALQTPTTGSVWLDAEPWSEISEAHRRQRRPRLQLVAQDPLSAFNPRFTVRDVLKEALRRTEPGQREGRLREVLDAVSLPHTVLLRHPLQLSGGQRQRVAIARALAADPEILFCDEAVSALDVIVQAQILRLLDQLKRDRDLALVFVSHDLGVVAQICDDVIVLKDGRVVESGLVEDVYTAPSHPYTAALLSARPKLPA